MITNIFKIYIYSLLLYNCVFCPPVSSSKKDLDDIDTELESLLGSLDYSAYLTQVIKELHKDEDFNKNIIDYQDSNSIANGLKHASVNVRSKLDELKRIEIARLNKLHLEWNKRVASDSHPLEMPLPPIDRVDKSHIDDANPENFNDQDLKRLIDRTSEIFNKIDAKDEETYKNHEMEKMAAKQAELENITDENLRKEHLKKWLDEESKKRSQHKPIHNPGSIEHLKSVWKEDDKMDADSFNPKSFFHMHDINGDGSWDIAELETLMQRELDKAYDPISKNTDSIERYHEMTRMRNALLSYADKDNNHLISYDEYNKWMQGDQYKEDKEWKIQEEMEPNYSKEEFDQYYHDYLRRNPEMLQPVTTPSKALP